MTHKRPDHQGKGGFTMKKMENIMCIRLPQEDVKIINQFAEEHSTDKSTAVRELVEMGKVYFAINEYVQGKASIGKTAETAGLPLGEMMDLLVVFGIKNTLDIDDYLESKKIAGKYV